MHGFMVKSSALMQHVGLFVSSVSEAPFSVEFTAATPPLSPPYSNCNLELVHLGIERRV